MSYHKLFITFFCLAWLFPALLAGEKEDLNSEKLVAVELATVGVSALTGAPVVILRDNKSGRIVPIWVGAAEARAIAQSLHGIEVPRPMTHDLMANILQGLGAVVDEVIVYDLRGGAYYGRIHLRVAGEKEASHRIESRPSDAMALALRTGADILVAEHVLEAALDVDFLAPEAPEQVVQIFGMTVVQATDELKTEHNIPQDKVGVLIRSATGIAAEAGLLEGDLILQVNETKPADPIEFFNAAREAFTTGLVHITYLRDGKEHTVMLRPPGPLDSAGGAHVQI